MSDPAVPAVPMPWWGLPVLCAAVEAVFATALVMAFLGEDKTLLNVMCTAAIAQAMVPLQWFFGSSKSSQDKDATQAASMAKKDETIASTAAALATSTPTAITTTTATGPQGEPASTTTTTGNVPPVSTPSPAPRPA